VLKVLAISPLGVFSSELRKSGVHLISIVSPGNCFHPDDIEFDFYRNPEALSEFVHALFVQHKPDVCFQDDNSSPLIHAGLAALPIPKLWYAIESHLHAWHKHFAACFDFVFFAQKNKLADFSNFQKNSAWLPLFMSVDNPEWVPWPHRTRDTVFLGTLNEKLNPARTTLLRDVQSLGIQVDILRGDYLPVFSQARIVLNQSVNADLNFRFFEAPGCGALLITDDIGQSDVDILIAGEDFLLYKGAEELATKIQWALAHPDMAEAMARRAFDKIRAGHMRKHRAKIILDKLTQLANRSVVSTDFQRAQLAFSFQLCSLMDYPENVLDFFQKQGRQLLALNSLDPDSQTWIELTRGLAMINQKDISSAWKHFHSKIALSDDPWLNHYWQSFKVATTQMLQDLKSQSEN
jgi:hypothetical protein